MSKVTVEDIVSSISLKEVEKAEQLLCNYYKKDINCDYIMNIFKINGVCSSKRTANTLYKKLYSLLENNFLVNTHGLSHDGDNWYFYLNLKDKKTNE